MDREHTCIEKKTGKRRKTVTFREQDYGSSSFFLLSCIFSKFSTLRVFISETTILKGYKVSRQVPGSPVTLTQTGLACHSSQDRLHSLHKAGAFFFLVKPKQAQTCRQPQLWFCCSLGTAASVQALLGLQCAPGRKGWMLDPSLTAGSAESVSGRWGKRPSLRSEMRDVRKREIKPTGSRKISQSQATPFRKHSRPVLSFRHVPFLFCCCLSSMIQSP